jgi:hypothetical protein
VVVRNIPLQFFVVAKIFCSKVREVLGVRLFFAPAWRVAEIILLHVAHVPRTPLVTPKKLDPLRVLRIPKIGYALYWGVTSQVHAILQGSPAFCRTVPSLVPGGPSQALK